MATRLRIKRLHNELTVLFEAIRPPKRKEHFLIFSPVLVDIDTDPKECKGMPFFMAGQLKEHQANIYDLESLIHYCNQSDIECVINSRRMPFTSEYIQAINSMEDSSWSLIGPTDQEFQ